MNSKSIKVILREPPHKFRARKALRKRTPALRSQYMLITINIYTCSPNHLARFYVAFAWRECDYGRTHTSTGEKRGLLCLSLPANPNQWSVTDKSASDTCHTHTHTCARANTHTHTHTHTHTQVATCITISTQTHYMDNIKYMQNKTLHT